MTKYNHENNGCFNLKKIRSKKIRGLRRKCKNMEYNIYSQVVSFPEIKGNCRHEHAPVSQSFIDGKNTKKSVKKLFIQTYINAVQYLVMKKPKVDIPIRALVIIDTKYLFNSQIDVFFGDGYYSGFFDRNDDYQKWIPLPQNRNIIKEFGLKIPENLKIKGYKEILRLIC